MKHSILNKKFISVSLLCICFLLISPVYSVNAKPFNDNKAETLYKEKIDSVAVFNNKEKNINKNRSLMQQLNDYILSFL